MAKELPYFKFITGEWLKGDINICSYAAQGVFINICTYYWMKDGNMSLTFVQHKINNSSTEVEELINKGIISVDKNDNLSIKFLDEQLSEFELLSEKRSLAGKRSGESRRKNKRSTSVQQKANNIDIDKDKKEIIYMSELAASDGLNNYEEIAVAFWELSKNILNNLNINSTDLGRAKIKNWVDPVRLCIEKDERTADQFREIFEYLNNEKPRNGFTWGQNIRSGKSLREKFEQILTAARTPQNKSNTQQAYENLKRKFQETGS